MMEVVATDDASSSIYSSKFQALYHSRHGAIQESQHIFIDAGLKDYLSKSDSKRISILEIGYGTGLNALLTANYADKIDLDCYYTALEAYPIEEHTFQQLNYGIILSQQDLYEKIHLAKWDELVTITEYFSLKKINVLFELFQSIELFDLIYYDAFAPTTQPALWEEDMMKKMYSVAKRGSILVTYCAKGEFRRTLEKVGFQIERIPGPPGKRQMIRATKP